MTFIQEILNPPHLNPTEENAYKFTKNVQDNLTALNFLMNPSVITNANFSSGGTLITQADGDNAEFFTGWKVVGSSLATYTLTPQNYDSNSTIQSASSTYSGVVISGYTANTGLYFYQRQNNTIRKYQQNQFTYGLIINNNQNKKIKIRMDMFFYYDTDSQVVNGNSLYLEPGLNKLTSTVETPSLRNLTVGASPYTEFRLNFIDLFDGSADINMYQIKCEFGVSSTLLQQ